MKKMLQDLVRSALSAANIQTDINIQIDYTRDRQHGDFATNIALLLAKHLGRKPRDIAAEIVTHIAQHTAIKHIEIAGAGFINFTLATQAWQPLLTAIFEQQQQFGRSTIGKDRKIHIEFVSSNPTGPLHVGHGRGAAYGATLADLLTAIGCQVHREYYVNDAGRQMDIVAVSIWIRYLQLCGETIVYPLNAYQGDYITVIAQQLYDKHDKDFFHHFADIATHLPLDSEENKEIYIDAIIAQAKTLLDQKRYQAILRFGLDIILADIKQDLAEFGVTYQEWFSERQLWDNGLIAQALAKLQTLHHLYEKDGATWFRSTDFGDDKDRVVMRENGQYTYFASDIAYHMLKFDRGFSEVVDVLGADHHGYIPRLKAIIQAFNYPVENFHAPIVQFATLYRGKIRIPMSTRAGSFVTLRELREEVGKDAARFFYVMRKADQHMDFDLALAKSESNDNPVYYIQYAHARIASVFRQLSEKNMSWNRTAGLASLTKLETDHEKSLLLMLSRYAETIELAALQFEPHIVAHYLRDLADAFHSYYNALPFLVADEALRDARLCLIDATRQVIANGLHLLSVSAPDSM